MHAQIDLNPQSAADAEARVRAVDRARGADSRRRARPSGNGGQRQEGGVGEVIAPRRRRRGIGAVVRDGNRVRHVVARGYRIGRVGLRQHEIEIRRRTLMAFEFAEKTEDPEARAAAMNFVIIGGGPTGVEMAGAIAEIARKTLARDFRHIDPSTARVILVEGDKRLLSAYPEDLSASALKQLQELGVEVILGVHAEKLTDNGLEVAGKFIPCRVKVWAAGNAASSLGKTLGVPTDRAGRVIVQDDLTIPGHPEVQVIGDLANFVSKDGKSLPGVSPVAIQQGRHAARNILHMIAGAKPQRFYYWDKGSMATIGRNRAVADLNFVHFSGFPAWLAWLFVHVLYLVGFRNRIAVLFQWAWAYVTFNKGARLITRNFQSEHRPVG